MIASARKISSQQIWSKNGSEGSMDSNLQIKEEPEVRQTNISVYPRRTESNLDSLRADVVWLMPADVTKK